MPKQDLIFNPGFRHGVLVPFGARHPIRLLSKSCCSYSFGLKVIPPLPVSLDEHLKLFVFLFLVPLFYFSTESTPMLHVCTNGYAHMGIYIYKVSDCNSSCRSAAEAPPLLLGPCASPLSHSCSGYRPSHFKRVHLFRDALLLRRDLLVSHLCLLLSFERRNSSILCLAPP